MADASLLETTSYDELRADQEASWSTWGPNSNGMRGLLFARDHVWDIDGRDWLFRITAVWTPAEFIEDHRTSTGPWGEAVAWLRARDPALSSTTP